MILYDLSTGRVPNQFCLLELFSQLIDLDLKREELILLDSLFLQYVYFSLHAKINPCTWSDVDIESRLIHTSAIRDVHLLRQVFDRGLQFLNLGVLTFVNACLF